MKLHMKRFLCVLAFFSACIAVSAQNNGGLSLGTIVIDAGHGGKDPGCVSRDGKTYEKTITLDIATKLSAKLTEAYPSMKVILTRDDDTYVELEDRAVKANNADADLFISIHVNSVAKGTTANGFSVHCLGQSSRKGNDLFGKNLELCKRENSVILLEDDYTTKYQGFNPSDTQSYILFSLMQNSNLENSLLFAEDVNAALKKGPIKYSRGVSQDPFWVLWRVTMPAVLIEVGFISNPSDLETMKSEKGRDKIAAGIFDAIKTFKNRYDSTVSTGKDSKTEPVKEPSKEPAKDTVKSAETPAAAGNDKAPADTVKAAPKTEQAQEGGIRYGTQIFAVSREIPDGDPLFKGVKVERVRGTKLIKYIAGVSADLGEAKEKSKEIRKKFPDAFLVKIDGNNTELIR